MGGVKPIIILKARIRIPNVCSTLSFQLLPLHVSYQVLTCVLQEHFSARQESFTCTPQTLVNPVRALLSHAVLKQQGLKTYLKKKIKKSRILMITLVTLLYIIDNFASHTWNWEQLSIFWRVLMTSGPIQYQISLVYLRTWPCSALWCWTLTSTNLGLSKTLAYFSPSWHLLFSFTSKLEACGLSEVKKGWIKGDDWF